MILEAINIKKSFPRKRSESNFFYAVDDVNLRLESGKLTVLYGESGSGKSTLLNMLSGLLSPTEGKVMLDETDLYTLDDDALSRLRNRHFGVMPQGQTAIFSLTVKENVLLPYTLYAKDAKHFDVSKLSEASPASDAASSADIDFGAYYTKRADELLNLTGIDDLSDAFPSELSGGEMRRMAIARALLLNPDFILADEPTGDLDSENTEAVLSLFKSAAENGTGVLIVSHDESVSEYADEVLHMKKGKL